MRTFQTLGITAAAALATGLFAENAQAVDGLCDMIKKCENGCYVAYSKRADIELMSTVDTESSCPTAEINSAPGEFVGFNFSLVAAPAPVVIDCAAASGGVICEGWPKGDSVRYAWSATGSFAPDTALGTANPFRGFSCTPGTQGTVTLSAIGPTGATNTVTETITCPTTP